MELTQEQIDAGYFIPKTVGKISDKPFVNYWSRESLTVDKDTKILYYPGSFGTFHEGHMSVVKAAWKKYRGESDNVIIVVSPSNSDYSSEKYPFTFASNKHRYQAIKKNLIDCGIGDNVVIDLAPMLNYQSDQNIDTLLGDFCASFGLDYKEMTHKPVILCGKDRANFKGMEAISGNTIEVFFVDDNTGFSTSTIISRVIPHIKQINTKLFLRCWNQTQFELFKTHLGACYDEIVMIDIHNEIEQAKLIAEIHPNIRRTNCKEYAGFLPYVKISRNWLNAFEQNGLYFPDEEEYDDSFFQWEFLDSDMFTGGTHDYLKERNIKLHAVHDLRTCYNVELLDIDDFYKDDFCYPHIDVSSRCSLPPFNVKLHKQYNEFLSKIKFIKTGANNA